MLKIQQEKFAFFHQLLNKEMHQKEEENEGTIHIALQQTRHEGKTLQCYRS
jgi:hypothetical protein